jgi:pyruvate dehydrogenase E2 component (dihydrolipoamide acetyltransferase)
MSQIVNMPKLGLTMTSGKIMMWLKQEGDAVTAGESLLEMETEKISTNVESPADGYVLKIIAQEWEEKEIGAPLCVIGALGESWEDGPAKRVLISPAAKRIAEENGIDYSTLTGSGTEGRIEKKDIEKLIEQGGPAPAPVTADSNGGIAVAKRIPLSGPRKVAAARLAASKREIPHVYFKVTVDASAMLALKQKAGEAAAAAGLKKPTINDVVVLAVAKTLAELPEVNATFTGEEIVCYTDINIGIAVNAGKGLFVPVIRQADRKTLQQIADAAGALAGRAREGKSLADDLSGGTFTVSNLGAFGIDEFAAVINPPEAAILAVGSVMDTPCAINGGVFVRPLVHLTISVDHRVIDGALAAQFLKRLKEIMEHIQEPGM